MQQIMVKIKCKLPMGKSAYRHCTAFRHYHALFRISPLVLERVNDFEMIVILYKINEIYIKTIRTYFKNLVSLS